MNFLSKQFREHLTRFECTKIFKKVLSFSNKIVTHCQHGFVTKKSCFTNLLETYENRTLALDSGRGIDVIYLDYRKAFDSVPHCRLARKLAGNGLIDKILTWLTDFLSDHLQRVVLNGEVSELAGYHRVPYLGHFFLFFI